MQKWKLPAMALLSASSLMAACGNSQNKTVQTTDSTQKTETDFKVLAESFADLQLLRYQVPGWEELSLKQKTLAYYLYE
ncbi:MAG TPA: hypothetical protein VL092_10615, partial [Chitinophagaceae bacterium]|nr:hypothetical protein [Chitinophagaceae bacterium]